MSDLGGKLTLPCGRTASWITGLAWQQTVRAVRRHLIMIQLFIENPKSKTGLGKQIQINLLHNLK